VHQYRVAPFLRGLFPDEVIAAIAGHVDAKRYLCANRAGYHAALSEDSKRSLQLQGGIFTAEPAPSSPGRAPRARCTCGCGMTRPSDPA
jgi:predicted HD phosphohydrolase